MDLYLFHFFPVFFSLCFWFHFLLSTNKCPLVFKNKKLQSCYLICPLPAYFLSSLYMLPLLHCALTSPYFFFLKTFMNDEILVVYKRICTHI